MDIIERITKYVQKKSTVGSYSAQAAALNTEVT
jgi:hypothetical protein